MTISRKSIFIHTVKCAGSSEGIVCNEHNILIDTVNRNWDGGFSSEPAYNKHYKFSFVRNPWDRMVSSYSMFNSFRRPSWFDRMNFLDFLTLSFDCNEIKQIEKKLNWKSEFKSEEEKEYIRKQHICSIQNHSAAYLNPFSQLFDQNENQIVDFIGRFENLQDDFDAICDQIGISRQDVPHINKTNHKHYTEYYDDETRKIVEEKFAKDIEYFKYKFGD
jgi:chondroitin 4-sulfotransferase 11